MLRVLVTEPIDICTYSSVIPQDLQGTLWLLFICKVLSKAQAIASYVQRLVHTVARTSSACHRDPYPMNCSCTLLDTKQGSHQPLSLLYQSPK